ncbi:phage major capsid protein [Denitromonas sp.]|uniref:phage major capsid protein n=1 Tax=Denitromonas sp. TaxID=2734609 RepID=UPI003A84C6D5
MENLRVSGGKLRGTVRFGESDRTKELAQDARSGILRALSIAYVIETKEHQGDDVIVTLWQPYECSLVSVPADPTVGFGRSFQKGNEHMNTTESETQHMTRSQRIAAGRTEKDERERTAEVLALGREFNARDDAEVAVAEGWPIDQFRRHLLSRIKAAPTITPTELGLSNGDKRRFSIRRALLALTDETPSGEFRRQAGFELEVSRAWQESSGSEARGISIPPDVLAADDFVIDRGRRDLVVGTPSAGGNLVSTKVIGSAFIDLLRAKNMFFGMGSTILADLNGEIRLPRQTGGSTGYWVAENAAPSESQPTFDQVALTPRSIAAFTDFSRKLALQSSPDIENIIRRDLTENINSTLEAAVIAGSGSGEEPTGILNTSGVGGVVLGNNGGALSWDLMVDLQAAVLNGNVDPSSCGWFMNPKTRAKALKTQQFSGTSGANVYEATLAIGQIGVSTHLPSDLSKGTSSGICSAVIYGDASQVVIGLWGGLDLMVDPYTNATYGGKRVIAFLDCDVGLRRPGAFAVCKDVLTS